MDYKRERLNRSSTFELIMVEHPEPVTDFDISPVTLNVTNLGGIDTATIDFKPGVTLLTGRNATNRTSLLRALNGALGGTATTLKSTADKGQVTLTLGDDEFTRTYTRTPSGINTDGTPYTNTETVIDLFTTLLENNPARLAVERGEDLHSILMQPVDTETIEKRIRDLKQEKQNLEGKRNHIKQQRKELPQLEQRRQELKEEIATIDKDLNTLREEVSEFEADADEAENADEIVGKLDDHRQNLSKKEDQCEVTEAEIDALKDDLETLHAEQDNIPEETHPKPNELEDELQEMREKNRRLEEIISSLTTIVEFNEDLISGEGIKLPGIDPDDVAVTADLAPDETRNIICWTCGSRINRGAIQERLGDLYDVIQEKRNERDDIKGRIDALQEKRQAFKQQQTRSQELEQKIEVTEEKLVQREQHLEDLESTVSELRETIQDLEAEVAKTETIRESDLLETYEQLSNRQYERGQLEQQLDEIESKIVEIESLSDLSDLQDDLDELTEELERERTRVADLEREAVEQFNEHMGDLLDVLRFKNLARVWIERKTDSQGRGPPKTVFDLHVVRTDNTGAVYEDVIDHLSESEREVVGLVVVLAGYLAHKAYQVVPFMLLDSLEAIDADRIADLVAYFSEFASYLVVALLPEDAEALPDTYERLPVNEIMP